MFIVQTRTFGFQNAFAHAEKHCWALPQTGPQVHKLRTQDLVFRICKPISYRKHFRICGKKSKIYRKSANQQHHWNHFCNFHKNTFLRFNVSADLVNVFLKYNTLSPSFSAAERLFPRGAAIHTAK